MTAIVILNVVLATVIVAAILSLLGWSIVSDKAAGAVHARSRRIPGRPAARPGVLSARNYG